VVVYSCMGNPSQSYVGSWSHMGSCGTTCHSTQVNEPPPLTAARQAGA